MANECFSMSLIAYPLINEVIYWNTCGAVNNLSSLWKWKLWDMKQFRKFTTTVNIPIQPLSMLGFFPAPHFVLQDWIYFSNYQTLHIEAKEKKEKNWCCIISVTSFLLLSFYSSVWKKPSSNTFRANFEKSVSAMYRPLEKN